MGVKDLWSLLAPVMHPIPLAELRGQTLAVDLSIWVVEIQSVHQLQGVLLKPYLRNLFFRVNHLLQLGISLIFVIEGDAPQLKWETMAQRNQVRYGSQGRGRGQSSSTYRPKRSHFKAITKECCQLLEEMGVPYVHSTGEAEAKCALLNEKRIVDACLTDDGDVFLYGARRVYKNFTMNAKDPHVESYDMSDVEHVLGLTRRHLVGLAILTGCDYLPRGVPGVGRENVLKLFKYIGEADVLKRFNEWVDNKTHYAELEAISSSKKPSHCTQCGHPGLARQHDKQGCMVCGSSRHCDPQPYDYVCSCEWHNRQAQVPACSVELNIQKKAVHTPGFPWPKVLSEFLMSKDRVPTYTLLWKCPRLIPFLTFCKLKMEWAREYSREKLIPLITLWEMRTRLSDHDNCLPFTPHHADGSLPALTPHSIVKTRVRQGLACFEVLWNKLEEDSEFSNTHYTTVEDAALLSICFPDLVHQYQEQAAVKAAAKPAHKKAKKKHRNCDKENHDVIDLTAAREDVNIIHSSKQGEATGGPATTVVDSSRGEDITRKSDKDSSKVTGCKKIDVKFTYIQAGMQEMPLKERLLVERLNPDSSNMAMDVSSPQKPPSSKPEGLRVPYSESEDYQSIGLSTVQQSQIQQSRHVSPPTSSSEDDEAILPLSERLALMAKLKKKQSPINAIHEFKDLAVNKRHSHVSVSQISNNNTGAVNMRSIDTKVCPGSTDSTFSQRSNDNAVIPGAFDITVKQKSSDVGYRSAKVTINQVSSENFKIGHSDVSVNHAVFLDHALRPDIIHSQHSDTGYFTAYSESELNRSERCNSKQKAKEENCDIKGGHLKPELPVNDTDHSNPYISDNPDCAQSEVGEGHAVDLQLEVNNEKPVCSKKDNVKNKLKPSVSSKGNRLDADVHGKKSGSLLIRTDMLSKLASTETRSSTILIDGQRGSRPRQTKKALPLHTKVITKSLQRKFVSKEFVSQQSSHQKPKPSCKTKKATAQIVKKSSKPWYADGVLDFSSDDDLLFEHEGRQRGQASKMCVTQAQVELPSDVNRARIVQFKHGNNSSMPHSDIGSGGKCSKRAGNRKRKTLGNNSKTWSDLDNTSNECSEVECDIDTISKLVNEHTLSSVLDDKLKISVELNNGRKSLSEGKDGSKGCYEREGGFLREETILSGKFWEDEGSNSTCGLKGGFLIETPDTSYSMYNEYDSKTCELDKRFIGAESMITTEAVQHGYNSSCSEAQMGFIKDTNQNSLVPWFDKDGDDDEDGDDGDEFSDCSMVSEIHSPYGMETAQQTCNELEIFESHKEGSLRPIIDPTQEKSRLSLSTDSLDHFEYSTANDCGCEEVFLHDPEQHHIKEDGANGTLVDRKGLSICVDTLQGSRPSLGGCRDAQSSVYHQVPAMEQPHDAVYTSPNCSAWSITECGDFSLGCTLLNITCDAEQKSTTGNDDLIVVYPSTTTVGNDDLTVVYPTTTTTGNGDLTVVHPSTSTTANDDLTVVYPYTTTTGNDDVTVVYPTTTTAGYDDLTVVYPSTSNTDNDDLPVVYPSQSTTGNDLTVIFSSTSTADNDDLTVVYSSTTTTGNDDLAVVYPSTTTTGNDVTVVYPTTTITDNDDLTVVHTSKTITGNNDQTLIYPSTSNTSNDVTVHPSTSNTGKGDMTVVYPSTINTSNDELTVFYPSTSNTGNNDLTVVYPSTSTTRNDDITVVFPPTATIGNDDLTVVYPFGPTTDNIDLKAEFPSSPIMAPLGAGSDLMVIYPPLSSSGNKDMMVSFPSTSSASNNSLMADKTMCPAVGSPPTLVERLRRHVSPELLTQMSEPRKTRDMLKKLLLH